MRRNRMRSMTIDAENEEDFIRQYDKAKNNSSKQILYKKENKENIDEDEYDELTDNKKPKESFNVKEIDEDEYSDLGAINNDDEEELLGNEYENDDVLKYGEDYIIKKENNDEKGIEVLVAYLKSTIMGELKNIALKGNTLIFNKNSNIMSMSGNAIYDLNFREIIENILSENDNEYIKSNDSNNNTLRDYIFQNIESDSTLKIMVMSNNKTTKYSFMNKFFCTKEDEENIDEAFIIRKKQIKLFNKIINLKIFDTSDEFHIKSKTIPAIYYEIVSAFFIFVEFTNHNIRKYLDFIFEKINNYTINKTVVIFGINMLFKNDCTIDGDNLREYANEKDIIFIPMSINNFNMKNSIINNLLNLILIKRMDHKININSIRKDSKDRKLSNIKDNLKDRINCESSKNNIYDITKMNVHSSLGYKKRYRIKHINAFDLDDEYDKKNKRKLSADT
jgi:hypothetical protein